MLPRAFAGALGAAVALHLNAVAVSEPGAESPRFKPVPGANMPTVSVPISAVGSAKGGDFDVAIVGGGIIGLATANEVLRRFPNKTVVVLEKEDVVGAHQSSHNSGVIHAGQSVHACSTETVN